MNSTKNNLGLAWCLGSIVLVSLAQLLLKYAVLAFMAVAMASSVTGSNTSLWDLSISNLDLTLLRAGLSPYFKALILLSTGLAGYAMSMVCWFFALRHLPLNYAYPMLGLSYALVYVLGVLLLHEPFTLTQLCGLGLIALGIWLINSK